MKYKYLKLIEELINEFEKVNFEKTKINKVLKNKFFELEAERIYKEDYPKFTENPTLFLKNNKKTIFAYGALITITVAAAATAGAAAVATGGAVLAGGAAVAGTAVSSLSPLTSLSTHTNGNKKQTKKDFIEGCKSHIKEKIEDLEKKIIFNETRIKEEIILIKSLISKLKNNPFFEDLAEDLPDVKSLLDKVKLVCKLMDDYLEKLEEYNNIKLEMTEFKKVIELVKFTEITLPIVIYDDLKEKNKNLKKELGVISNENSIPSFNRSQSLQVTNYQFYDGIVNHAFEENIDFSESQATISQQSPSPSKNENLDYQETQNSRRSSLSFQPQQTINSPLRRQSSFSQASKDSKTSFFQKFINSGNDLARGLENSARKSRRKKSTKH